MAHDLDGADLRVLDGRDEPKDDLSLGVGGDIPEGLLDGLIGATRLLKDIKTGQGIFAVDQSSPKSVVQSISQIGQLILCPEWFETPLAPHHRQAKRIGGERPKGVESIEGVPAVDSLPPTQNPFARRHN